MNLFTVSDLRQQIQFLLRAHAIGEIPGLPAAAAGHRCFFGRRGVRQASKASGAATLRRTAAGLERRLAMMSAVIPVHSGVIYPGKIASTPSGPSSKGVMSRFMNFLRDSGAIELDVDQISRSNRPDGQRGSGILPGAHAF